PCRRRGRSRSASRGTRVTASAPPLHRRDGRQPIDRAVFGIARRAQRFHCLGDRLWVLDESAVLAAEREEGGDAFHRLRGRGILLDGGGERFGDGGVAARDAVEELPCETPPFGITLGVVAIAPRVCPTRLQFLDPEVVRHRSGLVTGIRARRP